MDRKLVRHYRNLDIFSKRVEFSCRKETLQNTFRLVKSNFVLIKILVSCDFFTRVHYSYNFSLNKKKKFLYVDNLYVQNKVLK